MDEFNNLLSILKKGDRITQNVLFMISEGSRYNEKEIGQALIKHCKNSTNKESVLEFLFILCSRDARYLSFFKAHKKELSAMDDKLAGLLCGEEQEEGLCEVKRIKLESEENDHEQKVETEGTEEGKNMFECIMPKCVQETSEEILCKNSGNTNDVNNTHFLNNEYLKTKGNPSILYPLEQCKLCGLRFKDTVCGKEALCSHIDEHRRKARVLNEKDCVSRELFPTFEAWTKSIEKIKLNLKVEVSEKVIHSGGPAVCEVCRNRIEVRWDDEEDNWMLKDAITLERAGDVAFCHRKCLS